MKNKLHVLLAAACLGGCLQQAAAAELGRNFAGELCHIGSAPLPDAPAAISCGDSSAAAGQIWVIAPDQVLAMAANARRDAIIRLIASESEDETLDCAAAQSIGSGNVLLRICTLRSNGWPRIVLAAALDGRVYRAQGAPSMLPVLEAAVAAEAQTPLSRADAQALEHAVRGKFADSVLRASTADYASYGKLVEDGRLAAAAHDYASAESDYRRALAIEEKLFGRDAAVVGETLGELALQVSNRGRFGEAAALFRRARPIIEASASLDARARLDSYMALDAANARNYKSALSFATAATAARRNALAAGGSDSRPGDAGAQVAVANSGELAHSLRIEAEMALRLGNYPLARARAEEALWIVTEQPGLPLWWRADTVALMGEINEAQNRVVQAEHDFRDARDLDRTLFGDTAPTALADFNLGQFYARQQLYPPALEAFRAGFDIANNDRAARTEVQPDVLVDFIAAETASANGKISSEAAAEIFRNVQLSRTGVADQAIARIVARAGAGDPALADLIGRAQQAERERDRAQVELAAEFAKLDEERSTNREQQLAASLKLASTTADELWGKVRESFPDYTNISEPSPVEIAKIQTGLAPEEALIIYVVGGRSSYALVVRPNSFAAVPLTATRDGLMSDVTSLRGTLRPALGRVQAFSLHNAQSLYVKLFGPFQDQLAGADHLILVPGPVLANLPFGLLVSRPPDLGHERDYAHAAWLLREFAISNVPSPQALVALRDARLRLHPAPRPFLGVGAPAFRGSADGAKALADLSTSCREEGPISPELLRALPPLPETAAEVQTVAARIGNGGGTVLLGGQATESNFRSEPLDQYAVIYLATHGILPGELRCASEPGLAFSPPSSATTSTNSDGLLTASEITELKLNTDLVVLSACNTAEDSEGLGGESLESLSNAFLVAGSRSVLASHWEISSAPTKSLMMDLFARAREGAGLAESLRQSQLDLIARAPTSHPFYWAAFVLMGEGGPLRATLAQRSAQAERRSRS
jgi:CHAT domain-containing protein